jgi:hypothetical protein
MVGYSTEFEGSDMTQLPNFLIVGAAKSGTTSIHYFLKQHPQIFMSSVKEPKFISSQSLTFPFRGIGDSDVEKTICKDFSSYRSLFKKAKGEKILGEASTDTLYYADKSVEVIKKILGNPKILIVLRNPVDRAFSNYVHLVKDGRENLNFAEALEEEENRIKNNWDYFWHYKSLGMYYRQVKSFLENFPEVQIFLFDQLKDNMVQLIKDVFSFLEVDVSYEIKNSETPLNASGIPKNIVMQKFLSTHNVFFRTGRKLLNDTFLEDPLAKFSAKLRKKNLARKKMDSGQRKNLVEFYREDILNLSDLIHEDISHWLTVD